MLKTKKILMFILISFSFFNLFGCEKKNLEEKHATRIEKRIQKQYIEESGEFTSFDLYPLYDENDKLKYFLVEFEPCGFLYIEIRTNKNAFLDIFSGLGDYIISRSKKWEDKNGKIHYESHFKVANIENKKRYLIEVYKEGSTYIIPAVKIEEKYVSVASLNLDEIIPEDRKISNDFFISGIYFIHKAYFNL